MNYTEALETVNRIQAQMGQIGLLETMQAYVNGCIALSREEADDFEKVYQGLRWMFAPVEG